MKTAQTAPTAPEAGILTGASPSVEPTIRRHGTERRTIVIRSTGNWASPALGVLWAVYTPHSRRLRSNESILMRRALDSADVR